MCWEKTKTSFYKRGKTNQCKSWKFIVILWLINQAGMTLPLVWCHSPVQKSLNQTDRGIRQRAETRTLSLPASSSPASTLPSAHAFCLGKVSEQCAVWGNLVSQPFNSKQLIQVMKFIFSFPWFYSSELIWDYLNIIILGNCTREYNDLREYWTRASRIYHWP